MSADAPVRHARAPGALLAVLLAWASNTTLAQTRAAGAPVFDPAPVSEPALASPVITRVASLSEAIGCRGLLVHAESEQARSFYEHLIPEFERSPTDPLHLLLLVKDIRRTLGRSTRRAAAPVAGAAGRPWR